jgi:hypothetical protein
MQFQRGGRLSKIFQLEFSPQALSRRSQNADSRKIRDGIAQDLQSLGIQFDCQRRKSGKISAGLRQACD